MNSRIISFIILWKAAKFVWYCMSTVSNLIHKTMTHGATASSSISKCKCCMQICCFDQSQIIKGMEAFQLSGGAEQVTDKKKGGRRGYDNHEMKTPQGKRESSYEKKPSPWMVLGIFWNHTCAIKPNLHTPAFQCLKKPGAICRVALLRGIPSFSKYTSFGDDAWVLLHRAENHCNWPRITQPQLPQNV